MAIFCRIDRSPSICSKAAPGELTLHPFSGGVTVSKSTQGQRTDPAATFSVFSHPFPHCRATLAPRHTLSSLLLVRKSAEGLRIVVMAFVSSSCTVLYSEAMYGSALYAYFEEKGEILECPSYLRGAEIRRGSRAGGQGPTCKCRQGEEGVETEVGRVPSGNPSVRKPPG